MIYGVRYQYNNNKNTIYIEADSKDHCIELFKSNMYATCKILNISEDVKKFQLTRQSILLNIDINFERDYMFG